MERRQFLKNVAAAAALQAAPAMRAQKSANDTIGVACVGVGTRGFQLLLDAQACPNTEIRVICDLYKPHVERARKVTKNKNVREVHEWEKAVTDKDVDVVLVATPDFWHAPIVIAAAEAGKDIYCEKGWCRTLVEAKAMRKTIQEHKRVLQLGHNYNSLPTLIKAKEIFQSGQLGKVPLIRTYIDRTGIYPEWQFYGRYDLNERPKEATADNIDWDRFLANATKRPFDPERFFRWRCWWEYGTGIAGDLMSHLWDSVNGVAGLGIPETALVQGDKYFWKDDRDVPDQWHVFFDYPKKELAFNFECVFHNRHVGEVAQYLGRDMTMEVSHSFCRTYMAEWKPDYAAKLAEGRKRAAAAPELGLTGEALVAPDYVYQKGEVEVSSHMQNFLDCTRSREQPRCGVDRAFQEAAAIVMSVEAFKQERKVRWDAAAEVVV
jgi:predicted dehydrogenase